MEFVECFDEKLTIKGFDLEQAISWNSPWVLQGNQVAWKIFLSNRFSMCVWQLWQVQPVEHGEKFCHGYKIVEVTEEQISLLEIKDNNQWRHGTDGRKLTVMVQQLSSDAQQIVLCKHLGEMVLHNNSSDFWSRRFLKYLCKVTLLFKTENLILAIYIEYEKELLINDVASCPCSDAKKTLISTIIQVEVGAEVEEDVW